MARKQIEGTEHVRRKMSTLKKAVIGIAALALASASGYLFVTKTDTGAKIQEKVATTTESVQEVLLTARNAVGGSSPVTNSESIIRVEAVVETFDSTATDVINETGGYVSGGGTLKSGDSMVFEAFAFDGYYFDEWELPNGTTSMGTITPEDSTTPTSSIITYTYNEGDSVGKIVARFKKNGSTSTHTYTFKTSPQIGKMSITLEPGIMDVYSDYVYTGDLSSSGVSVSWQLTYDELDQNFSSSTVSSSHGKTDSGDKSSTTDTTSVTVKKIFDLLYDIYVINANGTIAYQRLNNIVVPISIDINESDGTPYLLDQYYPIPTPISFNIDGSCLKNDCTILLAPHTYSGNKYRIITKANPEKGGITTGDSIGSSPFSGNINAIPSDGYKFEKWTWNDPFNGPMSSKEKSFSVTPKGVVQYTAHFVPEYYTIELESVTPEEGGTVDGIGNYGAHKDVPITIKPADGYTLESWNYTTDDGSRYTGNTEKFTISDLTSDIKLSVTFTNGKARIDVKASPVDGGTVEIKNDSKESATFRKDYEEFVPGEEDALLMATPAKGYVFLYWKDSQDRKYEGFPAGDSNILPLHTVASSEKYTAYFAPKTININTKVYPDDDAGSIEIDGEDVDPVGGGAYTASPATAITLKASEKSGYHFQKFVDSNGREYTSNPTMLTDIVSDISFTAVFIEDEFEIKAMAVPAIGGKVTVDGRAGSNMVKYGETVTISAIPNDDYDFMYFEDQNGKRYERDKHGSGAVGDPYHIDLSIDAVNGAETYKAYFVSKKVSLGVSISPEDIDGAGNYIAGKVDATYTYSTPGDKSATFDKPNKVINDIKSQTNVTLKATEYSGYHFSKYVDGRGNVYTDNPLTITNITDDTRITAIFVPDEFEIKAVSSPSTGGTVKLGKNITDVREGSAKFTYADDVYIIAKPESGYIFRYFEDQNGNKYDGEDGPETGEYQRKFKAVNGPETYKAVFGLKEIKVTAKVDPDDSVSSTDSTYKAGSVDVTYTKSSDGKSCTKSVTKPEEANVTGIKGQTNVKIKAVEKTGYHFAKFVDDEGNSWTENPLIFGDLVENKYIEAVFVPDEFEIRAEATPVTGGTTTVAILDKSNDDVISSRDGSHVVKYNDKVRITATAAAGYALKYFEDKNGTKYSGNVEGYPNSFEFFAVNGAETYKAVFGMSKASLKVKVDPSNEDSTGYVAGGFRVDFTNVNTGEPDTSGTMYSAFSSTDIKGQTSVKITAIPRDGYHFAKFVDTDGNVFTENPLVYPDLGENKEVEIIFVPDSFEIKALATPIVGGSANIIVKDKDGNTISEREGTNTVAYNDNVTIVAIANGNFEFQYFEDQSGSKYGGTKNSDGNYEFSFKAVNGAETYKVVFAQKKVLVSVKVDPSEKQDGKYIAGGFRVDFTKVSDGQTGTSNTQYKEWSSDNIKGQTSVKITAIEGDGYHFAKFVDTDGNVYNDNPLIYPDLVENKEVEVIFVPDEFTISAQATPVTGGKVDVAVSRKDNSGSYVEISRREGSNTVAYDDKVTLVAKPRDSYSFRYFEDQNGSKYGGIRNDDGEYEITFNAVNGSETYKAVFAMESVEVSVKVDPNKTNLLGNYTAGGYRIEYTNMAGQAQSSGEKYKPDTYTGIKGQTSVKITAIEGDGYHFAKFVDTDGNVFNDNPLIYPDLVEDKDVEVIFVPDEFTISAQATPVIGGRVDVTVGGSTREGSNKVAYDDEVTITAKPNSGFAFRYFEDQNGSKYSGTVADDGTASFKFRAVNGSETYKAVFAMSTVHLSVKVDPNTLDGNGKYIAGKFKVNYTYIDVTDYKEKNIDKEGDAPNFKIENIKGQTSVKITASELSGYKFSKFIDDEGNIWTENPMVLGNLVENKDIEIIYVKEQWRIEGQASPETGGHVFLNGVESGLDVEFGDEVTIEAKPNEGYKFKFFKDELGNEYLSNPIKFKAINGNEKYVAYFSKDDVNITIDLAPEGSGTVRFNSEPPVSKRTTYPNNGKSSVTLTAAPKDGNKFLYWKDQDGNSYTDNPLVVSDIGRDLIFTAIFDNEYETIRAVSSPASGGTITKIINGDGSITLIARASRGYKFANWMKPKGMTLASKFTIPANAVNAGDVYTAHFKIDPNYDAKSDITKEKFYREWRRVDTPNYTVTRDYIKMLASQAIADGHYGNATPELKTYNAIANARGYFSKAQAEDGARLDAIFGDSELMTAEGEKLTPDKLPDEDSYLNSAEKFTGKKFGDKYDTEILTVKRVLQPTGFNNNKRTYLWRYTGAEYKDNIYLLYEMDDKKTDFVTPIVDEDGVLKFTIDDLKDHDVVAVVRVKIK